MFAVIGITGQVGGAVARTLLAKEKKVRAVVRNPEKAVAWRERRCDIAVADVTDAAALEKAFTGVEGAFLMLPPLFDPSPDFAEAQQIIASFQKALAAARPPKVVCLSTIGAQAKERNLLTQLHMLEQGLSTLPIPITFLRPGWFMENFAWDVAPARENGVLPSFLRPLDKRFPMVATQDVGNTAAELLVEDCKGHRVVELEGPTRGTPNEVAATFAKLLGRDVHPEIVPRETWESQFRAQGMKNPMPRVQMLDGFNEGWIDFEQDAAHVRKGNTALETVLRSLVQRSGQ